MVLPELGERHWEFRVFISHRRRSTVLVGARMIRHPPLHSLIESVKYSSLKIISEPRVLVVSRESCS